MKLRFVFSYGSEMNGAPLRMHNQTREEEVPGEAIDHATLATAEGGFLEWFRARHPNSMVLQWNCTSADGRERYSEYRSYLTNN